jgi:phospholipid/cholesterol/gamma-HCH transport system ATP-binding protein
MSSLFPGAANVAAAPPSAPPLIEVKGLVKRFGDKTVLDGVDLTIERGETVCVIGGSGSGKTTLARLVMGLDRPTAGRILLEGVDLASLPAEERVRARRRFAMVFQRSALLDSLTVFDNVAFPLREETDLDEDEVRGRVLAQLEELGVRQAAGQLPGELSGGMAKRVGIARAMVTGPEVLVYDEPTSGLDPVTSRVVDGLIERLRERFFVTSLVITHDMLTAFEVADRVVLLAGGRVTVTGAPEQVFRTHGGEVLPFALSSGIDLERLAPRTSRKSPAEIRALRAAAHRRAPAGPR